MKLHARQIARVSAPFRTVARVHGRAGEGVTRIVFIGESNVAARHTFRPIYDIDNMKFVCISRTSRYDCKEDRDIKGMGRESVRPITTRGFKYDVNKRKKKTKIKK